MTFDMRAARRYADTGDLMKTTKWIYHALDEIDRLHDALKLMREKYVTAHGTVTDDLDLIGQQANRIAELEAENERHIQWGSDNATDAAKEKVKNEKLRDAIKKLGQEKRKRGKALVEERARLYCRSTGAQWDQVGNIFKEEYRLIARDQLRRERKL